MAKYILDSIEFSTAFVIPFDAKQASLIGLFTAIWGQIDHHTVICIVKLLDTHLRAGEMLMENMTSGPRINLFHRLAKERIKDDAIKKLALKFYADMSPLIEKRNHIMHGMWGFYVDKENKITIPGANYSKRLNEPLLITELPKIISDVAKQTHVITKISDYLLGNNTERADNAAMFFGDGPPPEWL